MKNRGEIKAPAADAPTFGVPEGFWENAKPYVREKKSVHLRVDKEVFDYFQEQGKGHLTRMNTVLRSYVEAQRAAVRPRKDARSKP